MSAADVAVAGPGALTAPQQTRSARLAFAWSRLATDRPLAFLTLVLTLIAGCFAVAQAAPYWAEWLLAAVALAGLAAALRGAPAAWQAQVWCVCVLSIAVELLLSHVLRWYVYDSVPIPPYVPVGHGIVYLAALSLSSWIDAHPARRPAQRLFFAAIAASAVAAHLTGSADEVGLVASALLLVVAGAWRSRRSFLLAMWLLVSWLEVWGTAIGEWAWRDSALGLLQGNPPAGIVAAYIGMDCLVMLAARQRASSAGARPVAAGAA